MRPAMVMQGGAKKGGAAENSGLQEVIPRCRVFAQFLAAQSFRNAKIEEQERQHLEAIKKEAKKRRRRDSTSGSSSSESDEKARKKKRKREDKKRKQKKQKRVRCYAGVGALLECFAATTFSGFMQLTRVEVLSVFFEAFSRKGFFVWASRRNFRKTRSQKTLKVSLITPFACPLSLA